MSGRGRCNVRKHGGVPCGSFQHNHSRQESDSSSDTDFRDDREQPVWTHRGNYQQFQLSDRGCDVRFRGTGKRYNRRQQGNCHPRGSYYHHEPRQASDSDSAVDCREPQPQSFGNHRGGNYNNTRGRRRGRGHYSSHAYYQDGYFSPRGSTKSSRFGEAVQPRVLVEVLIELPDYCVSLLKLFEYNNMQPLEIREVVESNKHIFKLNGEVIELRPQINICTAHTGPTGCQNRSSCADLHICNMYVSSWCSQSNCSLGHKWYTDHNKAVLRTFNLDRVPVQSLIAFMRSFMAPAGPTGQLDVCRAYNSTGCTITDCDALHVCLNFVTGLTKCNLPKCRLNHNLLTPECCVLLRAHGISPNEAPRDVAVALLAAFPSLAKAATAQPASSATTTTGQSSNTKATNVQQQDKAGISNDAPGRPGWIAFLKQKISPNTSDNSASSDRTQDSSVPSGSRGSLNSNNGNAVRRKEGADTAARKNKQDDKDSVRKSAARGKTEKQQTVWSHYLKGDTAINEICYYSVENLCKYEGSGCKRLHASQHYHWQISEQGSKWLNLRSFQVGCLEHAFCDPSQDGVTIPRLDPARLESSVKGLLTVMGRDTWQANFQAMIVVNSDQSRILYLRRLCTEYISGLQVKPSIYCWFFLDIKKKWVKYGKVDTAGEQKLVSSVTSSDIESHFRQNEYKPLQFKNNSYTYVLDFVSMTQTNQNTNVQRQVRRRPEPHIKDGRKQVQDQDGQKQVQDQTASNDLPSTWDPMQPEERFRLVPLTVNSAEYNKVVSLLNNGIPTNNITKIERIQNPFLWRALQNKIKEMTTVYGDIKKVDVRQVFHGTRANVVPSICAENFDWRLHGTSTGQACGRGTYFSPQAGTSYGYCKVDSSGLKYMFVARVAVGSITQGNSSTVRPPINPSTQAPYDSTGDGVNVIVKYDKQEYCPEYILTLR